ncbi:MAG TPA: OsmC family peroxiredoxin [Gaiellaceae bacterium]|nr:OsmC family peroxiredoxin [Gaiellaceae bacterium]
MPRIEREAEVAWRGSLARGSGVATAGTGAFELPIDLPSRVGDPGGKTSPEELLAAAHAGCYTTSLAGEIARAGGTVDRLDVRCTVTMDEVAGQGHLIVASELDVEARAEGIDADGLERAARAADDGCTFSALVRASATVTVRARLSSDEGGSNGG